MSSSPPRTTSKACWQVKEIKSIIFGGGISVGSWGGRLVQWRLIPGVTDLFAYAMGSRIAPTSLSMEIEDTTTEYPKGSFHCPLYRPDFGAWVEPEEMKDVACDNSKCHSLSTAESQLVQRRHDLLAISKTLKLIALAVRPVIHTTHLLPFNEYSLSIHERA